MSDDLRLMPLRIPGSWIVEINKLTEVDPEKFTSTEYEHVWEFDQDILFIVNKYNNIALDLGWYPSLNPLGEYCLRLMDKGDWDHPDEVFHSRNINFIVDRIEYLLLKYS